MSRLDSLDPSVNPMAPSKVQRKPKMGPVKVAPHTHRRESWLTDHTPGQKNLLRGGVVFLVLLAIALLIVAFAQKDSSGTPSGSGAPTATPSPGPPAPGPPPPVPVAVVTRWYDRSAFLVAMPITLGAVAVLAVLLAAAVRPRVSLYVVVGLGVLAVIPAVFWAIGSVEVDGVPYERTYEEGTPGVKSTQAYFWMDMGTLFTLMFLILVVVALGAALLGPRGRGGPAAVGASDESDATKPKSKGGQEPVEGAADAPLTKAEQDELVMTAAANAVSDANNTHTIEHHQNRIRKALGAELKKATTVVRRTQLRDKYDSNVDEYDKRAQAEEARS